ncbi:hypothetical protein BU15DRAFT_81165 [Melanogaster broomeanus]|nr:hypothetical protein BU15DRAFT_81165 [Melanogaster broomeanus]
MYPRALARVHRCGLSTLWTCPPKSPSDSDITLSTQLYIAPEVSSRRKGPGITTRLTCMAWGFFEMVYALSTRDERIAVTGDLRKPEIYFSRDWEAHPTRHKQIITWLLRHDLAKRLSALECSQNAVLPPRMEDEYSTGALRMMDQTRRIYKSVLSALFSQPASQFQGLLYDLEEALEHAQLKYGRGEIVGHLLSARSHL